MKSSYKKLAPYIRQVDARNKNLEVTRLLGVSIEKRFIKSIANTIGTDMTSYKIVRKGQFAYGPVTSRNGDKVSIALLEEEECIISSSYIVFEISDTNALLPEYLNLWFKRPEFDRYARFHSHGSAREIFDWEEMCNVTLPIPSIDEQQKIVDAYNTIERRIAIKRQINDNLESQVEALYNNIASSKHPNGTLSAISIVETGKRPISVNKGAIPLVGAGGIMGFIDSFNYNSPILTMGRVGTHGIIQRFEDKCWVSDNAIVIKTNSYEYVYQFLKKVDYTILNRGSTQPLITQTDIKQLDIYLPSDDELKHFNHFANAIMANFSKNNQEILKLVELQVSMINSLSTQLSH